MKKYKYSRKEALRIARDSGYGYKTFEKYLLAKESNEEYSQRIMMEQVPKKDNKDYRYVYCCPAHGEYYKVCPKCNPTPSQLDEKQKPYRCSTCNGLVGEGGGTCKCSTLSTDKECKLEKAIREWKRKGWDVNQMGYIECFCPKCNPTPSQLDDIEEIEELDSGNILGLYRMANRLIRNQNLIIKQLKQK